MANQRKAGAVLSYLSIGVSTAIQLLYTPFLVRCLGQSEYGLYSLVSSIIGYLTILDFGFGNAIIVYTAKYRAKNDIDAEKKLQGMFKIIFYLIAVFSMMLGMLLFLGTDSIFRNSMSGDEINKAKIMMLILIFNLGMTFAFNIYSSIIAAYEKFVFQKLIAIIGIILKPLVMLPLLIIGFKSIAMVCVLTIINAFILISNYAYCRNKLNVRPKFSGFDKKLLKIVLGYSIWIFLAIVVDKVNWSVDNFILGIVSGTIAVSIYSIAGQINTIFVNLSTAVSSVFLPKMSKMIERGARGEELTSEFIKVGRVQFHILFLALSGFVIFGKFFIRMWVGIDYDESYYVALCLIVPVFFSLLQSLGLSIMQAMNKYRFKALTTFAMAFINIAISFLMASKFGPIGAALGTTIAIVLNNIIVINIYYYKAIKINVLKFWAEISVLMVKLLPAIVATLLLLVVFKPSNLIALVVFAPIYVLLYSGTVLLFSLNKYERHLLRSFLSAIRSRAPKTKAQSKTQRRSR